ncbi:MAG TPA: hypothetical protein V6D25_19590 [Leptolyngbyaceae cyanobacterium]
MPELVEIYPENIQLYEILENLPQYSEKHDFGADINEANLVLLSDDVDVKEKVESYFNWVRSFQPCIFGRMSAANSQGLSVNVCWISENEIAQGDLYLIEKIQTARREWKDKAELGESHGFLVIFNSRKLAFAKPSVELLDVCKHISSLYFTEHIPIEADVIYTEAMPLRDAEGNLSVFKAGANIFYTGAHKTRNHDRRIPGGLMISINSPGHYANSLVIRGLVSSFSEAVEQIRYTAWRSIGNGGIGDDRMYSATWHNRDPLKSAQECPFKKPLPPYIPEDFSTSTYSSLYHTDILVPISVTVDGTQIDELDGDYEDLEVWDQLRIDYLEEKEVKPEERNYALFYGHPITEEAKYHNPWPPIQAINKPRLAYGQPRKTPEVVPPEVISPEVVIPEITIPTEVIFPEEVLPKIP